jgi:hypothetical protein
MIFPKDPMKKNYTPTKLVHFYIVETYPIVPERDFGPLGDKFRPLLHA